MRMQGFQDWFRTFVAHTLILGHKQLLIARREWRSTVAILLAPLWLLLLMWVVEEAVLVNTGFKEVLTDFPDPEEVMVPGYPRCLSHRNTVGPCIALAWTSNNPALAEPYVSALADDHDIPSAQIRGFASPSVMRDYLVAHPNSTVAALVLNVSAVEVTYSIWYNHTTTSEFGLYIDEEINTLVPVSVAVQQTLTRMVLGSTPVSLRIRTKAAAHPAYETWDIVGDMGPGFILAAMMFNLVTQISGLVGERLQLRPAMTQIGMSPAAYWVSWTVWCVGLNLITVIELVAFGALLHFAFFINNSFPAYFFLLCLFAMAMVPLTFCCAAIMDRPSSAASLGFVLFLLGSIAQQATTPIFKDDDAGSSLRIILFSLFPPLLLSKGFDDIASAGDEFGEPGFRWEDRGNNATFSLNEIYLWLFLSALLFSVVAWWLDGIRHHHSLWFCFKPSYWRCAMQQHPTPASSSSSSSSSSSATAAASSSSLSDSVRVSPTHSLSSSASGTAFGVPSGVLQDIGGHGALDVDDEATVAHVRAVRRGAWPRDTAVVIAGLGKDFVSWTCGFRRRTFSAVQEVAMVLRKGHVSCLLGHNGAGKSTLFGMLTGQLPPSRGGVSFLGHWLSHDTQAVRQMLGVCPQHDVVWPALTAREHLTLFARLHGVPWEHVESAVAAGLADVELSGAADQSAGTMSGGMRRRLCVAMAFMGDPAVVVLDEPTSGMDPISRQGVWELILRKREGRVILLTSHSMEEAEALADTVAIMNAGRIVAFGTPEALKSGPYAGAYVVAVDCERRVRVRVARAVDGVAEVVANGSGALLLRCGADDVEGVVDVVSAVDGVGQVHIRAPDLEDVFLNVERAYDSQHSDPSEGDV